MAASRNQSLPLMIPIVLGLLTAGVGCVMPPPAPEGNRFSLGPNGLYVSKPVVSMREQRYQAIVPQRFDFSCGAASLATVLVHFYGDPVEEEAVVRAMLEGGDQERIRQQGFSLLDMSRYAKERGYEAKAYDVEPEFLDRLAIPAITLVNTGGYSHFVVIKGVKDEIVYLADPALGQRTMPRSDFLNEWSGLLFFVAAHRDDDAWGPLEELEALTKGPKALVSGIQYPGLRNLTFNPLEF